MMKICLIFASLFVFQCCEALRCNKCKDPKDFKCAEVDPETCPVPSAAAKAACLVHIYLNNSGNTVIDKKCVILDESGKYRCDQSLGKEEKCDVCTENMCNTNGGRNLGAATPVVVLSVLLWVFTRLLQ